MFVYGLGTILVRVRYSLYSSYYLVSFLRLVLYATFAYPICQFHAFFVKGDVGLGFIDCRRY